MNIAEKKNSMQRTIKTGIILSMVLLIIIVFFTFYPSLFAGFVYFDDQCYVLDNTIIKEFSMKSIARIFNIFDSQDRQRNSFISNIYIPLVHISFGIEQYFFNVSTRIFHFTNLLLHILNCLLVYWLFFCITRRLAVSFATAVLFGIHPLHVESVAWIAERKDLLYSFFFLFSIVLYIYYRRTNNIIFYLFSNVVFAFSLLSKPMAISLPFVLLLLDYLNGRRIDKNVIIEKIPYLVMSAIAVLIVKQFTDINQINEVKTLGYTNLLKICVGCFGNLVYLIKLLAPFDLSCVYPYPEKLGNGLLTMEFLLAPVLFLFIVSVFFILCRFSRAIVFGFLFVLVTILPVNQFLFLPPGMHPDHYTYIPFLGFFYIIAESFSLIYYKKLSFSLSLKRFFMVILIIILSGLSLLSWQYCKVWKDGLTLWNYIMSKNRNSCLAYFCRGSYYLAVDNLDSALKDFNEAIKLNPAFRDAYINRGLIHNKLKEYGNALNDFNTALKIDPGTYDIYINRASAYIEMKEYDKALEDMNRIKDKRSYCEQLYINYGDICFARGKYNEAVTEYERALKINPNEVTALVNRGNVYSEMKDFDRAIVDYTNAVRIKSNNSLAYTNRGNVYREKGKLVEAISDYDSAIKIDERNTSAYTNRGCVYFMLNKYNEAMKDFTGALAIDESHYNARLNRAIVYYKMGRYTDCLKDLEKMLKMNYQVDPGFINKIRNHEKKARK